MIESIPKQQPHPWVEAVYRFNTYLSEEFLGGPKFIKLAWVINLHKGGTLLFVALLMLLYQNYTTVAWVYLALHGTYGLCWVLKDLCFPDDHWQRRVTLGGAVMSVLCVLGPYWLFPFLLISDVLGREQPTPCGALLAFCIAVHTGGIALMMSADAQKYFTLKVRAGLIEEGLFKTVRHPNYLGEMLVYGTYALLVQHWLPWLILAVIWTMVFGVNMLMIEASLARYPGWEAYRARTGMLLPRLIGRKYQPQKIQK